MAANEHVAPLDPGRPWIDRAEDLPNRMNWLSTLLIPTGESPRLHFKRAWTLLFMLQFLSVFGIGLLLFVMALAGVDTAMLGVGAAYLTAGIFIITTLMSFVIHSRRLLHAGKFSLWAILVLLPLAGAAGLSLPQLSQKAAAYEKMYEARTAYLDDPRGYQEEQLQKRREQQAERARQAAEDGGAEAGGEARGRGGPPGRRGGFNPENELPSQEAFILRPLVTPFYGMMILFSLPLVPWSLMWVARTPIPKRQKQASS